MQICTSWETINTKVIQTNCKHAKKFTIVSNLNFGNPQDDAMPTFFLILNALHYGKFICMFAISLCNFCVYRLPAGTNLQYFCISVNQILTNNFAIQTQYFCKSAHNICNQNSFLQFKCKRIANSSQNNFKTICDKVQIYCT